MTKDAKSNNNNTLGGLLSNHGKKESFLNKIGLSASLNKYHSQPLAPDYQRMATERKFKEVMS